MHAIAEHHACGHGVRERGTATLHGADAGSANQSRRSIVVTAIDGANAIACAGCSGGQSAGRARIPGGVGGRGRIDQSTVDLVLHRAGLQGEKTIGIHGQGDQHHFDVDAGRVFNRQPLGAAAIQSIEGTG